MSASLVVSLVLSASATAWAQAQPADPQPAEPPAEQPAEPAAEEPAEPPAPQPVEEPPAEQPAAEAPAPVPAVTYPTMEGTPPNELHLGDNFFIRFGIQLQHWTELLQDRVPQANGDDGEFQWNTYLRRARFFFGGAVFKKVTYLILLESANLGRAVTLPDGTTSKSFATNVFQDAFMSFNFNKAFSLQAGLMLVPYTRNILQSTATYISVDVLATSATYIGATQTSTLRDTGLQIKGQLAADHFEYRLGAFQGIRQSSTQMGAQGGKNPFRLAGYLQYNFLDPESGYVFHGHYYGHKKVAGISGGFDYQKLDGTDVDAYWAVSGAAFVSFPLNGDPKSGGDEISGLVQFLHFNPGDSLAPPPAGIAEQNDIAAELGYYNKAAKISAFGKLELRQHSETAFEAADLTIYGGGLKYYLAESALNATLAYNRLDLPNAPEGSVNPANQIVFQLQLAYY